MTDFINRIFASLQFAAGEGRRREEGQTLVEYALILTMVSIGSIAVLLALSGKINGIFTDISNAL
jgi:Flp pilus assembly pilin Flp